ncbi:hypothetical protein [Pseudomonas sp. NY15354]|uniref:hypothetical protein n=1 Tax=Pseudomonas sp. NY15354 TaxID=3400351 RepID=UPI003A88D263
MIVRSLLDRPRADRPVGCKERLDKAFLEFLKFVWQFDCSYRAEIEAIRLTVAPQVPTVHLRGKTQIDQFLQRLDDTPLQTAMDPARHDRP